MAVTFPFPKNLPPVAGVRLACTRAVKSRRRDDLTLMAFVPGTRAAGVFTRNRCPAAPVALCREHLNAAASLDCRAAVVNAGIANAGTGGGGLRDARQVCKQTAQLLNCAPQQTLPFSTGVIMERLPMKAYGEGLRRCAGALSTPRAASNWTAAARAILTTDTVAKGAGKTVAAGGRRFAVTGIAKGSGMIHPNMATMLAFVATDAAVPAATLRRWTREAAAQTFNAVSVDGDTSTNDSFMLFATGQAGPAAGAAAAELRAAVFEVCARLAEAIARDGEGATKLIRVQVEGGNSARACRNIAEAIGLSPLVKTAVHAEDANVGRLLMALGKNAGRENLSKCEVTMNGAPIIRGTAQHPRYCEKTAARLMKREEIIICVNLKQGAARAHLLTCDLSAEYVRINADYRRC